MIRQMMSHSCQRGGMKSARVQSWCRAPNVRNVWARVGESHTAVVPTLLDSLGSDEPSNLVPEDVGG